ncbi:MAG: acetolactate decarboxylase [Streptococcaceae bacterium]|jgi:acetolactate decarboxylase|nr:acetolactate decarboxylase [Streptococcaceae bacterium]
MSLLFQHNTLASLMSGLYGGTISIGDVLKHGDFGIGTSDGLNGELIVIDGAAFLATDKNEVIRLNDEDTTPYAAVTTFSSIQLKRYWNIDSEPLLRILEEELPSQNLFSAIRIQGKFSKMHVRVAPKQERPFTQPFVEVAKNQPEYEQDDVEGMIVGFWTPELFHGASVKGFHLHFLSEDKTFGGHILDFRLAEGVAEIGEIDSLLQDFPVQANEFLKAKFDVKKLHADISKSE